jgi:hypothetical protein
LLISADILFFAHDDGICRKDTKDGQIFKFQAIEKIRWILRSDLGIRNQS